MPRGPARGEQPLNPQKTAGKSSTVGAGEAGRDHFIQNLIQSIKVDWLEQAIVTTRIDGRLLIALGIVSRDYDYRDHIKLMMLAQRFSDLDTIQPWQRQV